MSTVAVHRTAWLSPEVTTKLRDGYVPLDTNHATLQVTVSLALTVIVGVPTAATKSGVPVFLLHPSMVKAPEALLLSPIPTIVALKYHADFHGIRIE